MKVGIFCGRAHSSAVRAVNYYDSILAVGHEAVIVTVGDHLNLGGRTVVAVEKDSLIESSLRLDCSFFMNCNDPYSNSISELNSRLGWEHIPIDAHHKDNLDCLSDATRGPTTWQWNQMEEIPKGLPIFIKPVSGCGTHGFHSWAYKNFSCISEFKRALVHMNETYTWQFANSDPGVLGSYVIQEFFPDDTYSYIQCLNDGVAKTWFHSTTVHDPETFSAVVTLGPHDDYGLLKNTPKGHIVGFQYFERPERNVVFDFNTRCGGAWSYMREAVFPDLFLTFFDNLLNNKQSEYVPKFNKFKIDVNYTGTSKNDSIIVPADDFPIGGMKSFLEIQPL